MKKNKFVAICSGCGRKIKVPPKKWISIVDIFKFQKKKESQTSVIEYNCKHCGKIMVKNIINGQKEE